MLAGLLAILSRYGPTWSGGAVMAITGLLGAGSNGAGRGIAGYLR